jgi:hypothetical protein
MLNQVHDTFCFLQMGEINSQILMLYTTTLFTIKHVIPAKTGIQENTRFRVKPGMTN